MGIVSIIRYQIRIINMCVLMLIIKISSSSRVNMIWDMMDIMSNRMKIKMSSIVSKRCMGMRCSRMSKVRRSKVVQKTSIVPRITMNVVRILMLNH